MACRRRLAPLGLVTALLLFLVQAALSAPVTPPGRNKLTGSNAGGLLRGQARAEWAQLNLGARQHASDLLSNLFITEADVDMVHFDSTGHIYMVDTFVVDSDEDEEEDDTKPKKGRRERRAFSDMAPSGYTPSSTWDHYLS
jgi:hypothetical protein